MRELLLLEHSGSRDAALVSYNVLTLYEHLGDTETTMQLAEHLLQLLRDPHTHLIHSPSATAGSADNALAPAETIAVGESSGGPRRLVDGLSNAGEGLSYAGALYLHARCTLLCGQWEQAAAELIALLEDVHSLRASIKALGVRHSDLLRQALLATLHCGRLSRALELLQCHGAELWPSTKIFHADALLCLGESAKALDLLEEDKMVGQAWYTTMSGCAEGEEILEGTVKRADRRDIIGLNYIRAGEAHNCQRQSVQQELMLRNNYACLLVCHERYTEAETELRRCAALAPDEMAPAFNLAFVLWKSGERRCACEGWLVFRGTSLGERSDTYLLRAREVMPLATDATTPSDHVSGAVSEASSAALDRLALSYMAELRYEEEFEARWRRMA